MLTTTKLDVDMSFLYLRLRMHSNKWMRRASFAASLTNICTQETYLSLRLVICYVFNANAAYVVGVLVVICCCCFFVPLLLPVGLFLKVFSFFSRHFSSMKLMGRPPSHLGELRGTVKIEMKGLHQKCTVKRVVITGKLLKKERWPGRSRGRSAVAIHLHGKALVLPNRESRLVGYWYVGDN